MKKSFLTYALALTLALLSASGNANAAAMPIGVEVAGILQELKAVSGSAKDAVLGQLESEIDQAAQEIITTTGTSWQSLNAAIQASRLDLKAKLDAVFNIPDTDLVEKVEALKTDLTTSLLEVIS